MWIEMPVSDESDAELRPKYRPDVSALIVYRGEHAYVAVHDGVARHTLSRHPDVRVLTDGEAQEFEQRMGLPPVAASRERPGAVGLGDLVRRVTRTAGIGECAGCQRRRTSWNRITVWGWWRGRRSH